ncbi:MAG TPA: hypothetical protein DEA08_08930 [Planctomycetes bacterium]|nr:hypothetical protein [Planctomycetota bacterium]
MEEDDVGNVAVVILLVIGGVLYGSYSLYSNAVRRGEHQAARLMREAEQTRTEQLDLKLKQERGETARLAKELSQLSEQLKRARDPRFSQEVAGLRRRADTQLRALERQAPNAKLLLDSSLDLDRVVTLSCQAVFSDVSQLTQTEVRPGRRGYRLELMLRARGATQAVPNLTRAFEQLPRWVPGRWLEAITISRPGCDPLDLPIPGAGFAHYGPLLGAYAGQHRTLPEPRWEPMEKLGGDSGLRVTNQDPQQREVRLYAVRASALRVQGGETRGARVNAGRYFVSVQGGSVAYLGWLQLRPGHVAQLTLP